MDKENDNCELLFEYLRSILYDSPVRRPDLDQLDEPFRKLGRGLLYLQEAVEEMLAYSADLSIGNLSGTSPSRENLLCANLKNLHANLNHLTWQAKQVAAGDYSQHVSYLGEFSEAFNTMTRQLKEREALLKEDADRAHRKALTIAEYNNLLIELTRRRNEWIIVVDAGNRDVVYCNKRMDEKRVDPSFCKICKHRLFFQNSILNWQDSEQYKVWELEGGQTYYRITTFAIEWRGRNAYAHIVSDITDEKIMENRLASKAYFDALTGIRNRQFFEEYMEKRLPEPPDIILCYLDGLKFVNDTLGHNEGDAYIRRFVEAVRKNIRCTDVFARIGGDEFCVILASEGSRDDAANKFNHILESFVKTNDRPYPVSFSFGIMAIHTPADRSHLDEILKRADAKMYECKRINKQKYHK